MDIKKMRKSKGLNQLQFWTPIGVTQSGGSRYESDRKIPRPVQLLIAIAYGDSRKSARTLAQVRGK